MTPIRAGSIEMEFRIMIVAVLLLSGCDDKDESDNSGRGGNSEGNQVNADPGKGFCRPSDISSLGNASFVSGPVTAKIDSDGDPAAEGHDANWQPGTSGSVNGKPVNSSQYAFVVMSETQMAQNGVSIGDWATVTNTATNQSTWARVMDSGPAGGQGEISEAAATMVGISYTDNRFTVGDPHVSVSAFGNTAAIQGDCQTVATTQ